MSFSPEWLALREPVDHRSLSHALRAQVASHLSSASPVRVMDMGCGSGSNLRALADHLGPLQHWTLVDWDDNLLAHAREALAIWGEGARDEGGALVIHRADKRIEIAFERADLARHAAHVLARPLDLVTAAAFFDLVSENWMTEFSAALAARGTPLYTTLTYNGVERWSPPHAADDAMRAAFHAHQHCDKGFGPAAGPDAAAALARSLSRQGYRVLQEPSPWILTAADGRLIADLARGASQAVRETGLVASADIDAWLDARVMASGCEIGHADIFAVKT